jgi:hypothetical protein
MKRHGGRVPVIMARRGGRPASTCDAGGLTRPAARVARPELSSGSCCCRQAAVSGSSSWLALPEATEEAVAIGSSVPVAAAGTAASVAGGGCPQQARAVGGATCVGCSKGRPSMASPCTAAASRASMLLMISAAGGRTALKAAVKVGWGKQRAQLVVCQGVRLTA